MYRVIAGGVLLLVLASQVARFVGTYPSDPEQAWSNLVIFLGTVAVAVAFLVILVGYLTRDRRSREKALWSRTPDANPLNVQLDEPSLNVIGADIGAARGIRQFSLVTNGFGMQLWGGSPDPVLVASIPWSDIRSVDFESDSKPSSTRITLVDGGEALVEPTGPFGLLPAARRDSLELFTRLHSAPGA